MNWCSGLECSRCSSQRCLLLLYPAFIQDAPVFPLLGIPYGYAKTGLLQWRKIVMLQSTRHSRQLCGNNLIVRCPHIFGHMFYMGFPIWMGALRGISISRPCTLTHLIDCAFFLSVRFRQLWQSRVGTSSHSGDERVSDRNEAPEGAAEALKERQQALLIYLLGPLLSVPTLLG